MNEQWIELRDERYRLMGRLEPEQFLLEFRRDRVETVVDLRASAECGFTVISSRRIVSRAELRTEKAERECVG